MKRWLFIGMVLFVGVFLARDLFSATYDFTGTWNYTISDNWAVGGIECNPGPDASGTCTIEQTGDTFTFAYTSGVVCDPAESCTFEGTVDGAVYTCSTTDIVDDEGGSVTSIIEFTASSATSASGSGNSKYTHPSGLWECEWGSTITLTKSENGAQPIKYTLTVNTIGSGTVTLDPAGGIYDPGTIVQLAAIGDPGWQFYVWTGDVANPNSAFTTVTMDADKVVTAVFVESGAADVGVVTGGPAYGTTLSLSGGAFEGVPTSMEAPGDAPAVFPFGLIGFTIGELTGGATVTVALTMPGAISEGAVYYKYQDGVYTRYDNATGLDYGSSSFTITLTDGGPGDADGEVNGLIVDPGGPGLLTDLYFPHVDTNSPWGTEIALINTSAGQPVSGTLNAYSNTGQLIDTMGITLGPHGRRQITIADEFANHTNIGYLIFETDAGTVQGYTKFYVSGQYRVAVPAVKEINTGDIYISHIDSSSQWWTGVSLLNTTDTTKTLTIDFDTGQTKTLTLAAKEHQAFTIAGLFEGQSQPDIHSAVITNASGVVGLELFGSGSQLSGILIKDATASTLYYPHVEGGEWWTGVVAYNPASSATILTLTPYSAGGGILSPQSLSIPGKGKYIGTVSGLSLPPDTAWFRIDSISPLTGFELFGTTNGNQLAGYTGVGINGKEGVFAKVETDGWTGIAFVNIEGTPASVTLTAYDNYGTAVATQTVSLGGYAKEVRLAQDFFTQDIVAATYIGYSSDRELVGFQLNGSSDGMMLDGLPGM